MAVSLNGDGTITGLSTLSSVTITGLTSLTTTDLTADTTTLVVDSANNKVGIGTASPSTTLQVVGTATATAFSGPLTGNVTGDVSGNAGTVTNGVYTTDIGSTVQAYDADLTTLAGLSSADSNFIVGSATGWVVESGATVRTSLGLGTAATTASTDYATAAQGTTADSALQPGDIGSTVQAYDADLTTLAGLSSADGNFIVGSATGGVVESGATARTSLGLGTAATTASTDYATAAQGTTADSALQPGDNISTLTNNSGFITGNETVTLSGDVTGSGTTSITTTLGTVAVSKGGTGQTSYTNGQLLIGNTTGNTLTKATLTAGSGIAVTNGAGSITIASTGGGGFSNMDVITSTSTWTNPGSVTKVKVTVVGAGGGGAHGYPAGGINGGGGGGGGGTAIEVLTIPTSPVPVTIGAGGQGGNLYPDATCPGAAGGTSSFGAYCSATGGGGGSGSPSPFAAGGAGGAGSGGTINLTGGVGGYGRPPYVGPLQMVVKGKGGASYFGENQGIGGENIMVKTPASGTGLPTADAIGQVGSNYGNGGSCNMYGVGNPTPAPNRGNGAAGVVIVEY